MATGESLPCQAGDILRFDHSGPAIVRRSYRLERKNGSFLVFIQVNRDLDPDADGYPHAVELIADEK